MGFDLVDPRAVACDEQGYSLFYEAWNTRAERYPDLWVFDRVLLAGARYRHTNLVAHDGRWYLMTTADYGQDLLIFQAEDPLGPVDGHGLLIDTKPLWCR